MPTGKSQKGLAENSDDRLVGISSALAYLAGEADKIGLHGLASNIRRLVLESARQDETGH